MTKSSTLTSERTEAIRLAELIRDVKRHEHSNELIKLMYQQVHDDTVIIQ